jgi:hypothetical protein
LFLGDGWWNVLDEVWGLLSFFFWGSLSFGEESFGFVDPFDVESWFDIEFIFEHAKNKIMYFFIRFGYFGDWEHWGS